MIDSGNEDAHKKFVEISEAYDCLSTATTRKIYDQYGHEGLENHKKGGNGGGGHDPFDIFSRFFGGGGHSGNYNGQRRGHNMEVQLALPLRDFYNGRELEFTVDKQVICEECEGSGSADGHVEHCTKCNGRGIVIQKHMLAPGMYQQVQAHCDQCGGRGKSIKNPCPICAGQRVVRKPISFSASIEKGMGKGNRIVFENEADESPDYIAGDLIVNLAEETPALGTMDNEATRTDGTFFRRKGKDLFWREILSLREAWMGDWTRNLTHLDGHIVQLSRKRGEVVQPHLVEVIPGEGMPVYRDGHMHDHHDRDPSEDVGALHVEYVVIIPDQMDAAVEKQFWDLWEGIRGKKGRVDLGVDSGRPPVVISDAHDEL